MARSALGAKAEEVIILDLRKLSASFDFFVLASGSSATRIQAIADDIHEELRRDRVLRKHLEGPRDGGWVLLDYGPVVAHIFSPQMREFYALERLWGDAPRVSIPKSNRKA
ncbi:MAG: ribosome silencing factor [Candidatus Omnitrophica bacterium]|nr:ribosome silencing factor [Candidatus Omnitrophota bacterium]